jgi:chemotaxis protein CheD
MAEAIVQKHALLNRFFHPQREKLIVKVLPGGVYATGQDELIATGLGSCISACMWDEAAGVGGMNHFLLPFDTHAGLNGWQPEQVLSIATRYGSHAMELLLNSLLVQGASRNTLQVKLFGGAQMMGRKSMVGEKNIAFILNYVEQEKLNVVAHDLGGLQPRKILFDPISGKAWLKRIPFSEITILQSQEKKYAEKLDRQYDQDESQVELFE